MINASDLVRSGECTPSCLLAMEASGICKCRCGGVGHGKLADMEVDFTETSEAIPCVSCGRAIPARGTHYLLKFGTAVVGVCPACVSAGDSRCLHAKVWLSCDLNWHDFWDHPTMTAPNRQAAHWYIDHQSATR